MAKKIKDMNTRDAFKFRDKLAKELKEFKKHFPQVFGTIQREILAGVPKKSKRVRGDTSKTEVIFVRTTVEQKQKLADFIDKQIELSMQAFVTLAINEKLERELNEPSRKKPTYPPVPKPTNYPPVPKPDSES